MSADISGHRGKRITTSSDLEYDYEDEPSLRRLDCSEASVSPPDATLYDQGERLEDGDDTVSLNEPDGAHGPASCSIRFRGKIYRGTLIFRGGARGRRTTVYCACSEDGDKVVIKDTYRRREHRFKEEQLLRHIHSEGDVPGVVRLKDWEYVRTAEGKLLQIGVGDDARVKLRLVFYDYGDNLLKAKSVNDLLKAIYDVLEVHRTIYLQRRVLHRDMSAKNILMYPCRADVKDRKVLQSAPPLIQEILDGCVRPLEQRVAHCLLIDMDHAVFLDDEDAHSELSSRTGTPTYIARSVCAGEYLPALAFAARMPDLEGEAYQLYINAHGPERYQRFAEKDASTYHGSLPPVRRVAASPTFTHRPEHDVESVFWTTLCSLLRVRPKTFHGEDQWAPDHVAKLWRFFHEHAILDTRDGFADLRPLVFQLGLTEWPRFFPAEMADVAVMVGRIADQVYPEYAFWPTQPPEDHLHEAVQRLVLQYLVEHRDKDIVLDPDHLRPTAAAPQYEDDD